MSLYTRVIAAVFAAFVIFVGGTGPAVAAHVPASSIPAAALLQPAEFAATLQAAAAPKPLILQVGFRKAYEQAHIPGSEYVGAASEEDGVQSLQQRVAKLPKDSAIVIYCGCCPWRKCPNIAAAYNMLQKLGFTSVKVIYFAEDFGTNWVDAGFPSTKGS